MRWGCCQQAGASSSCTAGWPWCLPACSLQPSSPCLGGARGHLVKPAAAMGQPGAGGCYERVDLPPAWHQPARCAGRLGSSPWAPWAVGRAETRQWKTSRCGSAAPQAGVRQCSCARHCVLQPVFGPGHGETETSPLRSP